MTMIIEDDGPERLDADGIRTTPLKVRFEPPESAPNYGEKGEAIELADGKRVISVFEDMGPNEFDLRCNDVLLSLHEMAKKKLPPGTVYEIRGKVRSDYGRSRGLAWYTNLHMQEDRPIGGIPYPGKLNELAGYTFLGRFKA